MFWNSPEFWREGDGGKCNQKATKWCMKSDLFSKVPCVKLWNGLKVCYKGCFYAEMPCFTEMSHGRVRKTPATCSSAWLQECCAPRSREERCAMPLRWAQSLNWHFPCFHSLWRTWLTFAEGTWLTLPARITPEFSTHGVNMMQASFSALTYKTVSTLPHRHHLFVLSLHRAWQSRLLAHYWSA